MHKEEFAREERKPVHLCVVPGDKPEQERLRSMPPVCWSVGGSPVLSASGVIDVPT